MNGKKIIKIVVIIAVICIPIMYSFFYLKSYWDPYGKLTGMKIAIVNLDKGKDGENQGQKLIDGLVEKDVITICQVSKEEAEDGLVNEEYFAMITIPSNFTEYLNSASTENKKVSTITYSPNQKMNYLASQIVAKVVSATEMELQSQVSEKVVDTLAEKLESVPDSLGEINDGADKLLDGASKLNDGLNEMNTGVATLNDKYNEFDEGVNSAYDGSKTLTNGIIEANTGVQNLQSGANKLDSAINQINNGADTLSTGANAGIAKLVDGAKQISVGAESLEEGTAVDSQLAQGASQVAVGVSSIGNSLKSQLTASQNAILARTGLNSATELQASIGSLKTAIGAGIGNTEYGDTGKTYFEIYDSFNQALGAYTALEDTKTAISESSTNGDLAALASGAKQVSTGIGIVNQGAQALNTGASQLASQETVTSLNQLVNGMGTLHSALSEVKTGTETLKSGVDTLSLGTNKLQTGSQTLTKGLSTLNSSSTQVKNALSTLKAGTQSAYDGSTQLKDGIRQLKDGVSEGIDDANKELVKLNGLSEFVKNPVEIEEVDYGEVTSYGIAFTPLFISVALWVGALMAYVVLYYDQDKRFKLLGRFAENKYIQFGLYFIIAIVQGIITAFLLKHGLGMTIQNNILYYCSAVLIAITFMSIIQFLIMNFGEAGKFIALLLLVLQLASSGGTFPVQLIDEGFQSISNYMPMTYTIKLVKEAIIMERDGVVASEVKVLLSITMICLAITVLVELLKRLYESKKNERVKEVKSI